MCFKSLQFIEIGNGAVYRDVIDERKGERERERERERMGWDGYHLDDVTGCDAVNNGTSVIDHHHHDPLIITTFHPYADNPITATITIRKHTGQRKTKKKSLEINKNWSQPVRNRKKSLDIVRHIYRNHKKS